jgi:hypothetical protein
MKKYLLILAAIIYAFAFNISDAKAEWYAISNSNLGQIYINDESIYIEGNIRSAEVRYQSFGQALFLVNCETKDYLIKTSEGEEKGYIEPGTISAIIADEICR